MSMADSSLAEALSALAGHTPGIWSGGRRTSHGTLEKSRDPTGSLWTIFTSFKKKYEAESPPALLFMYKILLYQ